MSFSLFVDEQRRRLLLNALNEVPAGEPAPALLLHRYCLSLDLKPTAEQIDNDLLTLQRLRLVERSVRQGVVLALITQLGRDVAAGRASAPGVADTVVR